MPSPPGAQEWGHRRPSGRSRRWALAGWSRRGRDGRVPEQRAGQAAGSLLPGELSDLLSPLHFRAAGEGDGAASLSLSFLLPATCFAAEAAVPSAEPGRRLVTSGDLLPGRNGGVGAPAASGEGVTVSSEFWILGCVSHPREPSSPAPVPAGSPGSFRPLPWSVSFSL